MSGSGALPRVPWRQSFGAKVALSILGTVAVLLGATLLAVRIETERQISSVTESATQRSRVAFADIVSIQEQRLSDILDPITGSRRTLAALEAALDAEDPELLLAEIVYSLDLAGAGDVALMVFTDAEGNAVLTVVEGETLAGRDPAGVRPLMDRILLEGLPEAISFQLIGERIYMIEARALELGSRFVGTAAFGARVDDDVAVQLGRIAGGEVCLVAGNRCVAGTPRARDRLGETLASVAGNSGTGRTTAMGETWGILSDPLNADAPEDGWRVIAVPLDAVREPFDRISRALTLSGFAGLFFAGLASILTSRGLAGPVRALMEAASDVAEGDYQAHVPSGRQDELGRLAHSFNEMTAGLRLKEQYRGVLDKVVSKEVAEELLQGDIELGGETREVSVLFADIRGFTSLTEGMPPQAVIGLINSCMKRMSEAVEAEGGVVDKYVGDEIMAVFGAPISRRDDARRAVGAAVRIQESIAELNRHRQAKKRTPIGVGVGISTGEAVAGNMGSPNRLNYTVLGEAVNLASRICASTPAGEVWVSAATARNMGPGLVADSVGAQKLKGFSRDAEVFRVRLGNAR